MLGFVFACRAPATGWSDERVWSEEVGRDQNHATVAAFPAGGGAVGWSDGRDVDPTHFAVLRWIGPDGAPGASVVLPDALGAKPDVELDAQGAVIVGYEGLAGIHLDRWEGPAASTQAPPVAASGPTDHSVDIAVAPDGSIVAVWYDQEGEAGLFRRATFDAELVPGAAETFATVDHKSPTSADVDIDRDGRVGIAWSDTSLSEDDALYLDSSAGWRSRLDAEDGPFVPRRPSVVARADGSWVVAWRARSAAADTPSVCRIGVLDADGSWLSAPIQPVEGDTDELVLAPIDDDHVWAVWTQITEPENGQGVIDGGVWSVPDEAWVSTTRISPSDSNARPHTDATGRQDGTFAVMVSWEHHRLDGVAEIRGRVGTLPMPGPRAP